MAPKKARQDWLAKIITTAALTMLIKLNTQVADIDKRLAEVEVTLTFIAPPQRHSLIVRPMPTHASLNINGLETFLVEILKGK